MYHIPTETIEDEANEFAAELLMPSREIKPYLADLNLAKLASQAVLEGINERS